eukprot:1289082-Amphidinium_carterae.1
MTNSDNMELTFCVWVVSFPKLPCRGLPLGTSLAKCHPRSPPLPTSIPKCTKHGAKSVLCSFAI